MSGFSTSLLTLPFFTSFVFFLFSKFSQALGRLVGPRCCGECVRVSVDVGLVEGVGVV